MRLANVPKSALAVEGLPCPTNSEMSAGRAVANIFISAKYATYNTKQFFCDVLHNHLPKNKHLTKVAQIHLKIKVINDF